MHRRAFVRLLTAGAWVKAAGLDLLARGNPRIRGRDYKSVRTCLP